MHNPKTGSGQRMGAGLSKTASFGAHFALALLPLLLAGCAPDAWRPDSPFDAFLDQVRINCWKTNIGSVSIPELMPDAVTTDTYFMDVTSRFYNGKISRESYVTALEGTYMARSDSPGIACIFAQMPKDTSLQTPPGP